MKELYFYRFVMICLVLGATFLAGHHYGEPVVEQFNDQFSFARSDQQPSQVRIKTPTRSFDSAVRLSSNQTYPQPFIAPSQPTPSQHGYSNSAPPVQPRTLPVQPTIPKPQPNLYPSGIRAAAPQVSLHWQPASPGPNSLQYQPIGTLTPFVSTNPVAPPSVYPPGVPSQYQATVTAPSRHHWRSPTASLEPPQKLGINSNPMPLPYKRAQPVLSLPPVSAQPSQCPCTSGCPGCQKAKAADEASDQSAATKTKTPLVDEIMEIRDQLGSGIRLKLVLPGEDPSATDVAIFEETIERLAEQKRREAKQAAPPKMAETQPETDSKKPPKPRAPSKR